MEILIISKKIPYPEKDGESIAIMSLLTEFINQGHSVTLFSIETKKHPLSPAFNEIAKNKGFHFYSEYIDSSVTIVGIAANIFSSKPYHASRFYSKKVKEKLNEILSEDKFDLIQLEGLYLCEYIIGLRKRCSAKIVLRSHNIESNIWKKLSFNEKNPFKKLFFKWQSNKLLKLETQQLGQLDAIVPISVSDYKWYQQRVGSKPLLYIPTGINLKNIGISRQIDKYSLYFIGALDWLPNLEGLRWFLSDVFPHIIAKNERIFLHVAGRNMPIDMQNKNLKNVKFYGEIEDAADFIKDKFICIVPLFSGSGLKIKIIEAWQYGKLVITTPVGAEGLPESPEKLYISAENEMIFCNKILEAVENFEESLALAEKAKKFAEQNLDNEKLTEKLSSFYKSLIWFS